MITLYLITNLVNGKKYVGQTVKPLSLRWQRHCWACTVKSNRMAISLAIAKYGKDSFKIEEIDSARSLEEANQKEVKLAHKFNCFCPHGYNLKAGGRKYIYVSKSTRLKISLANKGRKASDITRQRLSDSHKGYRVSESTKLKLSKIHKGKKPHQNTRLGASRANAKKYVLINPVGQELKVENMRRFCKIENLPTNRMSELTRGKIKQYKGWQSISK